MHIFRFNPVFKQWVLLGAPSRVKVEVTSAHLVGQKQHHFQAATAPKQPFVLDPERQKVSQEHLLHQQEAPVGEYELLLYQGASLWEWTAKEWGQWLELVQTRIVQLHHNPYLHYLYCSLLTRLQDTVEGYQRVGDLVATSHPVAGDEVSISPELRHKLLEKEAAFTILTQASGSLYIPSAPLHAHEVWFLPTSSHGGIEHVGAKDRAEIADILAKLHSVLHAEFPDTEYVLRLHTSFDAEQGWWIQFYKQDSTEISMVPVRPFPEVLVAQLRQLLGL